MVITEVKIKLMPGREDKLRAFCSVTLDDSLVIRELKVIEGSKGTFVAMPSRKLTEKCSRCGVKNHIRSFYCNECGAKLIPQKGFKDVKGNPKFHAEIAHPINTQAREYIQKTVLDAYGKEVQLSAQPGYKPSAMEDLTEE
ncbi:MAG: hypothetical protein A2Z34_04920 [Planctomycetes bacterium RBG_16_59_8]|nr:MAG: hypothetical protein A2Z34_04920 [Planctomycetes bacterium RBG_16_59_8]